MDKRQYKILIIVIIMIINCPNDVMIINCLNDVMIINCPNDVMNISS